MTDRLAHDLFGQAHLALDVTWGGLYWRVIASFRGERFDVLAGSPDEGVSMAMKWAHDPSSFDHLMRYPG